MNPLIDNTSTAPGRVRTYLEHPEYGTTPHSCTLYAYDNDPIELIKFTTIALKGGAGVKVIFPKHTNFDDTITTPAPINCTIDSDHDDYNMVVETGDYIRAVNAYDRGVILKPNDTIGGKYGILSCLEEIHYYAGYPIIVDLSELRPIGVVNSKGMTSSGPASFWWIFKSFHDFCQDPSIAKLLTCLGHINHTMRRGGYKKGIVTSAMDYECPLIEEYLNIDITQLQGSHKLGVIADTDVLRFPELVDRIIEKRNSQSLFLEKRSNTSTYFNVCQGIELGHRGTCLIWRVNLGLCESDDDIINAFGTAITDLVKLHLSWRNSPSNPGIYAGLNDDRQVALDVMGLANILSIRGIKYTDLIVSLEAFLDDPIASAKYADPKSYRLIQAIERGYKDATKIADGLIADEGNLLPLDRLFTVEPAQSHSYETKDAQGYITCRGIFPPFGRIVTRNSESEVERTYNHGNVETAGEVGADWQIRLCNAWQRLMDRTGRAHAISQDTYKEMDKDGFIKWLDSPSKTLYYAEHRNYNQRKHLAKSIAVCSLDNKDECSSCAE